MARQRFRSPLILLVLSDRTEEATLGVTVLGQMLYGPQNPLLDFMHLLRLTKL